MKLMGRLTKEFIDTACRLGNYYVIVTTEKMTYGGEASDGIHECGKYILWNQILHIFIFTLRKGYPRKPFLMAYTGKGYA